MELEGPSTTIIQETQKRDLDGTEKGMILLVNTWCDYVCVCVCVCVEREREHPKDATHQLLVLVNKFSKAAGYKIDVQKSVAFPLANKDISEKRVKQNNPIWNHIEKQNKIYRNKPDQGGERLICWPLQNTDKGSWRWFTQVDSYLCTWNGSISIIWTPYYPKQTTDFMPSISKYPWHFFTKPKQVILKCIWKHERPRIIKAILCKKNKASQTSDNTTKIQ